MAHHQGMCILGLLNLLDDNAVQRWFYENPQMRVGGAAAAREADARSAGEVRRAVAGEESEEAAALKKAG